MTDSKRRRVLYVITGLSAGGAELMLYRVATGLQARGWSCRVVCLNDGGVVSGMLSAARIQVDMLEIKGPWSFLNGVVRLTRLMRSWRPDIVHTWLYHADLLGGIAAKIAGANCVVWSIRNSRLQVGARFYKNLLPGLCAVFSRVVPDRIISCAQAAATAHVRLGYRSRSMVVVPNGYDAQTFKYSDGGSERLRRIWNIGDNELVIGVVGRYDINKGYEYLFPALGELVKQGKRFRVVLAGQGMESGNTRLNTHLVRNDLHEITERAGLRDDMGDVYSAVDLLLSASVSEGFPNVIAEAMLCETPVVATDVGDTRDIVAAYGWIVPPRDPDALAGATAEALLGGRDELRRRGRMGREHIKASYGIGQVLQRYEEVYKECRSGVRDSGIH